jgi:hypothetical protein
MFKVYYEKYLTLNLRDYPNLGVELPINIVILFATVALCSAFVALSVKRRTARGLLGQLMRRGAIGEGGAKTLGELGLLNLRGVRRELSSGGFIASVVKSVGGKRYTYEEYVELEKKKKLPKSLVDFDTERFYIPEDRLADAKAAYDRYDSSPLRVVVFCLLFVVIFVCISLAMPSLLAFIDSFLEAK